MNYIESFSMRDVYTASGQPGLWHVRGVARAQGIATLSRIINPKERKTVLISTLASVEDIEIATVGEVRVYCGVRQTTKVSHIFERMYDNAPPDNFDTLPENEKIIVIKTYVPDADLNQFKATHFSKILKWYKELLQAVNMLEPVVDPYEENQNQNNETNSNDNDCAGDISGDAGAEVPGA